MEVCKFFHKIFSQATNDIDRLSGHASKNLFRVVLHCQNMYCERKRPAKMFRRRDPNKTNASCTNGLSFGGVHRSFYV